jgi:hypothetical protein
VAIYRENSGTMAKWKQSKICLSFSIQRSQHLSTNYSFALLKKQQLQELSGNFVAENPASNNSAEPIAHRSTAI